MPSRLGGEVQTKFDDRFDRAKRARFRDLIAYAHHYYCIPRPLRSVKKRKNLQQ
jgi:hypothetical protein